MVHEVWGQMDHPSGLDIQFKFWHWVSTLQTTTPQPEPLFIPTQDRRIYLMIPDHPGVWKVHLVKVDFPLFWHPFCWFSLRIMGQNKVSDQLLGHFNPFLLQWYLFIKRTLFIKNVSDWCSRWWELADWQWIVGFTPRAISRVPRTGLVSSSGFSARPLDAKHRNSPVRGPRAIHILKTPPFGASVDPLWEITNIRYTVYMYGSGTPRENYHQFAKLRPYWTQSSLYFYTMGTWRLSSKPWSGKLMLFAEQLHASFCARAANELWNYTCEA